VADIEIEISNNQNHLPIDTKQLFRTVRYVLRQHSVEQAEVSLAIVDDDAICEIKNRYYDSPEATDVLSFDLRDQAERVGGLVMLDCEVIVNAERAIAVAKNHNIDPEAELNLYIVHGLLHLLGYDDKTLAQARKMHQREDHFLEKLNFGRVYDRDS